MKDVSFLLPARNEVYLERTIRDVLKNIRGNSEILILLDGYIPHPQIVTGDDRVRFIHKEQSIGQRAAINLMAKESQGKYLCKLDAHCAIDEGFDLKMMADCEYDWTVIPRMYNLNVKTWKPKLHKRTDYMYIGMQLGRELRAEYYTGQDWKEWHAKPEIIDDTMACMGPCFFMHKERFWELGGCDERHVGGWGQQGVEVSLKAWLSGGSLKVNKKTWFAHWFRGSDGGFPYPISGRQIEAVRQYSRDLWLNNKWPLQKRPIQWLFDKFSLPNPMHEFDPKRMEVNEYLYRHVHPGKHHPCWRGVRILKLPTDLLLYHRVVWEQRPEVIVEIGTKYGGLSLFLQDQLDLAGGGKVVTVDILDQVQEKDPRITYLLGDSTARETVAKVKTLTAGKRTMVILDGDHHRVKVKWELHHYAPLVSKGQFLVLEDCYARGGKLYGPGQARNWFLSRTKEFKNTHLDDEFLVGMNLGGWLQRV